MSTDPDELTNAETFRELGRDFIAFIKSLGPKLFVAGIFGLIGFILWALYEYGLAFSVFAATALWHHWAYASGAIALGISAKRTNDKIHELARLLWDEVNGPIWAQNEHDDIDWTMEEHREWARAHEFKMLAFRRPKGELPASRWMR